MTPILECRGVSKNFGGLVAVANVYLQVQEGHIHSVIGPNGAGKSTFFNLISGELPLSEGTVHFRGREITHAASHDLPHMGISRCFQRTNVFPKLSVFENVWAAVFARKKGGVTDFLGRFSRFPEINRMTEEIVADVGIDHKLHERAETLSHGQSRMLEVAITLAGFPTLMLLDEPTQGLAPEATHEMTDLIKRLAGKHTILLIEHKMHIVMDISDVISVLNLGQIIAEGKPDEIQRNELVQDAYLGRLR
jgi:branched-chain amino acid transport system ATP-binding protein